MRHKVIGESDGGVLSVFGGGGGYRRKPALEIGVVVAGSYRSPTVSITLLFCREG